MPRILHFVRHGQYVEASGALTKLGRAQAARVAAELSRGTHTVIHCSNMPRALETAGIVSKRLGLTVRTNELLREVLPTRAPRVRIPFARRAADWARLSDVELKFLRPAKAEIHEVVVCHGNLIRSLVARVLGTPRTHWVRMQIYHGSLTTLVCREDRVLLQTFNSVAHLPPEQRTFG